MKHERKFYRNTLLFTLVVIVTFFVSFAEAGKLKSASAYLATVQTSAQQVEGDLDELKRFLDSVSNTGSFITSDFWGTTPRWYLSGVQKNGKVRITSAYPFTRYWSRNLSKADNVRKIRNIAFYPLKVEDWSVRFNLDFSKFLAGEVTYQQGMYTDGEPKKLKKYLLQHGVPKDQLAAALKFHNDLYEPMVQLLMKGIYLKFNGLFEDVFFSSKDASSDKKLQSVFGDQLNNPLGHEGVIASNEDALRIGSWQDAMTRDMNNQYERLCLEGLERCIYRPGVQPEIKIEVTSQKFMIAKDMPQNQRFSQFTQLTTVLEDMVASGKVIQQADKGKYSIFRDAQLNGKYPGALVVDLKSGMGYWYLPIAQAKEEMNTFRQDFNAHKEALSQDIEKYLDGVLKDTVKKFGSQDNTQRDF